MKNKYTDELWLVQKNEMVEIKGALYRETANKLLELASSLNLTEARLLALLIALVEPKWELDRFPLMRIKISDFQKHFCLTPQGGALYRDIERAGTKLMKTLFRWPDPEKPSTINQAQLVSFAKYHRHEGWIELQLHHALKPFLCDIAGGFFQYRLEMIIDLQTPYAIRLYEWIKAKENMTHKTANLTPKELRALYCIPEGKWPAFGDIKAKILEPTIKAVNENTDMCCKYDIVRGGRGGRVKSIILSWNSQTYNPLRTKEKPCKAPEGYDGLTSAEKTELHTWAKSDGVKGIGESWQDIPKSKRNKLYTRWIEAKTQRLLFAKEQQTEADALGYSWLLQHPRRGEITAKLMRKGTIAKPDYAPDRFGLYGVLDDLGLDPIPDDWRPADWPANRAQIIAQYQRAKELEAAERVEVEQERQATEMRLAWINKHPRGMDIRQRLYDLLGRDWDRPTGCQLAQALDDLGLEPMPDDWQPCVQTTVNAHGTSFR